MAMATSLKGAFTATELDLRNPQTRLCTQAGSLPSGKSSCRLATNHQYNASGTLAMLFRLPGPSLGLTRLRRSNLLSLNDVQHSNALFAFDAAGLSLTGPSSVCAYGMPGGKLSKVGGNNRVLKFDRKPSRRGYKNLEWTYDDFDGRT
ncbi:hypothetical protein OC861_007016, partial [Tilletia horrida]